MDSLIWLDQYDNLCTCSFPITKVEMEHPSNSTGSLEIDIRLDEDGRTTFDPTVVLLQALIGGPNTASGEDEEAQEQHIADQRTLDYSCKTVQFDSLQWDDSKGDDPGERCALESLIRDAEIISDGPSLADSFWIPCDSKPRCALEKLAVQIFQHHVPSQHVYDRSKSGVEWWVQLRPKMPSVSSASKPEKAAISMALPVDKLSGVDTAISISGTPDASIQWHWDKDENLRVLTGGIFIHPHISTVTYLTGTNLGPPTMILQSKVGDVNTGEPDLDQSIQTGHVSWPRHGKHLSFDGSLLHGAPADIMPVGEFERQYCSDIANMTREVCADKHEDREQVRESSRNKSQRLLHHRRRVTFPVNIWLNHCPIGIQPFPMDTIGQLSPLDALDDELAVSMAKEDDCPRQVLVHATPPDREVNNAASTTMSPSTSAIQHFTWTLGGSVSIEADLPIQDLRNEMGKGGNVRIDWEEKGMVRFSVLDESGQDSKPTTN
jgi:hypothetical protein